MNFVYTKWNRNSALIEKDERILWRRRYLETIQKYREEGWHLYYLDETWVNAGNCSSKIWINKTVESFRDTYPQGLTTGSQNLSGKGKRNLHIGSEDGFVPGGLFFFEAKKINTDYYEEINVTHSFFKWMESIIR